METFIMAIYNISDKRDSDVYLKWKNEVIRKTSRNGRDLWSDDNYDRPIITFQEENYLTDHHYANESIRSPKFCK